MDRRIIKSNKGFTLIEVMIALAIFSVFVVSFITAQGYNVADSSQMRSELKLKEFLNIKMNEIITTPPELKESLTLTPETGKFKEDDNFKFEITYKKFKVPDYDKLKGNDPAEASNSDNASNAMEKKVFENVSKNLESILWQLQVKVIDDTSKQELTMSTYLINDKAEVVLEAF